MRILKLFLSIILIYNIDIDQKLLIYWLVFRYHFLLIEHASIVRWLNWKGNLISLILSFVLREMFLWLLVNDNDIDTKLACSLISSELELKDTKEKVNKQKK